MATSSGSIITDWKHLWQLVSGIHHETPENTVLEELLNVSKELQDGLLQFKETSASNTDLENLLKEKKQEKLLPFTQRLQELLDLESKQCWEILCYYLSNEYRGSASSLTTFISTEANMTKLLDDIWGYYTLERMIVLKIVKNLLVFYKVPNHPYHREYKQIVEKITLTKLRDSYIKQLEHLINEAPPKKLSAGEFFDYHAKLVTWSERNIRETIEVLHILLLIFEYLPVEVDHLKRLFNCFKHHSFGKQQSYLNPNISLHAELMKRTAYSEIVLFIKCIDFENPLGSSALAEEIIRTLDKDISRMYHNQENGPVLFAWMMLNLRCTNIIEDEDSLLKYRQFGKRALDLNCFEYLKTLVANSIFKNDSLVSRIARKTIYNQLKYMCDLFDADGSCAKHPFIYELLCELLSWPTLAKEFCSHEEGGVRSLYTTLLETFPIDFVHVSMIALALTKGGQGEYIYSQLEAMPILTDLYDENKFSIEATGDDEYVLNYGYKPFRGIDFIVPAGTTAAVMERPEGFCVHFRSDVNYFNVLHNEINCLLDEAIQVHTDFQSSERLRRVNAGLNYLESALQRTKSLSAISVEMVHPTEMCIDLLNKFKTVQNPPVQLMSTCLNVCTALLPLVDTEIFTRVINLNIFPVITNDTIDDYKKYALGFSFDSRLVGSYLVDVEKKLECYDFLLAYLSFLRTYTKMQKNSLFQVEIPGLMFLLREVFPHMHAWRFQNPDEKNKIYAEIMGFICDILDAVTLVTSKDKKDQNKCMLRDICIYSLLNSDNGFVLLKFVAVGNAYLQHTMELESNWMLQQTHGLMLLVRLSMRILMQLLRLKTTIFESTELTPLEALIYTQPKQRDTLRIIPVVTSYMSNIFDRWLPILSCRLLKRISLEFNMSLLACLDMEPDQIRLTFLQKLPDEFESDSLKIAVLELVEACIDKQPGVTEAFFKVDFGSEKRIFGKDKGAQIADSILTFMEDYLEAVEKEPNTVQNTLPSRIMNIFHSLWKHNKQMLVEELTQKPKFWQQLCKPLFSEFSPNVRAYTQLLNIMGIEIFCTPNKINTELKKEITKLFDPLYFEKWLKYVFEMPKTPPVLPSSHEVISDDAPEWLCRLQAFKDFLIIILNKQPKVIEIPQKQLKLLAEHCFTVLVERSLYVADLRPFIILSEMYLFVLLNFKHTYTESEKEDREMLQQLIQLLGRVASCYEDLHVRAKEACLAITIKCSDLLAGELLKDSAVALSFLHSVVSIICMELQYLENCVKAEVQARTPTENSSTSLILSLNLLKTVAVIFHNDGPGNWDLPFIANKLFQRLLSCTGSILQMYSKQKLSVELLDVLIVFAKGNCSAEFLYCDVSDYLWLKILPPKELLQVSYNLNQQQTGGWTVQKWWPVYTRAIELVTVLLQKHKHQFLKDILQFVGIHEEYLMDSLLLGKQSLEQPAMELIKCAVALIASLVTYEKQWRLEHAQSLFNLMRCVQMLMGHSISMFHQPKNLKFLIAGRRSQLDILRDVNGGGLVDEVITALNDLTEIMITCVKCLQTFSPGILELICEPEFLASQWEPIFEIHFGAPKLNENAMTLTFGTVLSVVGVFTKALSLQNYVFHEAPLNTLPVPVEADNNNSANRTATTTTSTAPRPFSKSLSVTSVSSANCPSNELLSNLDGELCLMALEHILFLAASQSMLALKNTQLPPREKQLIRREISTELITYHEYLRKKVLNDFREHKAIWHRRKHGQVFMRRPESDDDTQGPSTSSAAASRGGLDKNRRVSSDLRSMRVNVVRRLHLQQKQRPPAIDSFETTNVISPSAISSTPNSVRPAIRRQGEQMTQSHVTKRVHISDEVVEVEDDYEIDDDIEYFSPEEPKYSPLSHVQLVEEDYLHFMSNLFTVICQSD